MIKHRILWISLVIVMLLPGSTPAWAETNMYFGVGGSYAFSQIDADNLSGTEAVDVQIKFGDTAGFNARFGWRFTDIVGLELNFDYLPGFESEELLRVFDIPTGVKADMDVLTLMVDLKLTPVKIGPAELNIFGGLGAMRAEAKASTQFSALNSFIDLSAEDTMLCGELGLGLGISLGKTVGLNVEGSYVAGAGEFGQYNYAIGYVLVTAGIDFYF